MLSHRINAVTISFVMIAWSALALVSSESSAQIRRISIPKQSYYNAFPEFYSGDFRNASRDFQPVSYTHLTLPTKA